MRTALLMTGTGLAAISRTLQRIVQQSPHSGHTSAQVAMLYCTAGWRQQRACSCCKHPPPAPAPAPAPCVHHAPACLHSAPGVLQTHVLLTSLAATRPTSCGPWPSWGRRMRRCWGRWRRRCRPSCPPAPPRTWQTCCGPGATWVGVALRCCGLLGSLVLPVLLMWLLVLLGHAVRSAAQKRLSSQSCAQVPCGQSWLVSPRKFCRRRRQPHVPASITMCTT
jgi:hypothetical protein